MSYRISDIAAALGARFEGMGDLTVTGAAEPAQARADQLALAMDPRYADGLSRGQARAAVLWDGADWRALGLEAAVFAPRGRLAMARLTQVFATVAQELSIERAADHVDHIAQLAGTTRHCAIGTDLDGGYGWEQTPRELKSIVDVHRLEATFERRGYSAADIDGIFWGNWLRKLSETLP